MTTCAIVPLKAVPEAKRRLRAVLSDRARTDLVLWMFQRVLACLGQSPGIGRIVLVAADAGLAPPGARFVADPGLGLNAALARALAVARDEGATAALVVPADVPLIAPGDIAAILQAGRDARTIIVPDRARTGTNALLLSPPDCFDPAFGPGSFDLHCAAAVRDGLAPTVLDLPRIALDIDDGAALEALYHEGGTPPLLADIPETS